MTEQIAQDFLRHNSIHSHGQKSDVHGGSRVVLNNCGLHWTIAIRGPPNSVVIKQATVYYMMNRKS
jgi:hypothetical protein